MNRLVTWGRPYGGSKYQAPGRVGIFLYRKGRRCRWYSAAGRQIGPEQSNVAPALAWALHEGYRDSSTPFMRWHP